MNVQILEKLLVAAVADADASVRKAVFLALEDKESFNEYLAQADSLRAIFISLTDEVWLDLLFCYPIVCVQLTISLDSVTRSSHDVVL